MIWTINGWRPGGWSTEAQVIDCSRQAMFGAPMTLSFSDEARRGY